MVLKVMPPLQIDELVAQALENKRIDRKTSKDIESFRNVLSHMHSSLKVYTASSCYIIPSSTLRWFCSISWCDKCPARKFLY